MNEELFNSYQRLKVISNFAREDNSGIRLVQGIMQTYKTVVIETESYIDLFIHDLEIISVALKETSSLFSTEIKNDLLEITTVLAGNKTVFKQLTETDLIPSLLDELRASIKESLSEEITDLPKPE